MTDNNIRVEMKVSVFVTRMQQTCQLCLTLLKMTPFDRPYATFYWFAIVNIALSCTIFELFDVEAYRDLEIGVRGHSRSLKLVPFESLGAVSYSPSIVTMAVSVAVCEIFSVKE